MSSNYLSHLNQVATFMKVPPGKLTLGINNVPMHSHEGKTHRGFLNILYSYLPHSTKNLAGETSEEKAELYQWLEYSLIYVSQSPLHYLSEINEFLTTRTYFVAQTLTIADVLLYYILYNVMENLTYLEKEKYINLSRWFDNMQQNPELRQKNKLVDFNTNYLAAISPARH
ncbi:PREDICTED: eukaryotic translation elongation factor 1 epsilon-1 [Nicrophorus vespilloides]|uniref:Eukaryotic translation elongation factor 1 epsilon-1 n=1 Tax=Nicrophorus vespilloides TaxID=110193 RepID=A0ABM1MBD2_NICVS|nr:PREDICTED: eukaryotic translation elongation factor 1 epsilon-1 [Nicrophorus vespilloides]